MNVDEIGAEVCQLLGNQIWTWAAQLGNQKNWVRIYKPEWNAIGAAGNLQGAVRNGLPVNGQYPIVWFEVKAAYLEQPEGPFYLYLPLSTNGFSRQAREDIYPNFLEHLFNTTNGVWQTLNQAVTNYQNNHAVRYIPVDHQPLVNEIVPTITNYVSMHFPIIDQTIQLMV
jgi:hypothetical protein